jgi:hypothetical protein
MMSEIYDDDQDFFPKKVWMLEQALSGLKISTSQLGLKQDPRRS